MTIKNKFFQHNPGTMDVEPCELDDADYVDAELYRRLLKLYSSNLSRVCQLEDIIEDNGYIEIN